MLWTQDETGTWKTRSAHRPEGAEKLGGTRKVVDSGSFRVRAMRTEVCARLPGAVLMPLPRAHAVPL